MPQFDGNFESRVPPIIQGPDDESPDAPARAQLKRSRWTAACYARLMRRRGPLLAVVAMAFLAGRLLGLHFHAEDHDHLPAHEAVAHVESEADAHHLDDHLLNGDQDIESTAMPVSHPASVAATLILVFLVSAALAAPPSSHLRTERPPLRPPRLRRRSSLLPPSQGPPLAV